MDADDTEQSVIDYLLEIRKICTESRKFIFPSMGGKLSIPLFSIDKIRRVFFRYNPLRFCFGKNNFSEQRKENTYPFTIGY